jgi:hypothetical protein
VELVLKTSTHHICAIMFARAMYIQPCRRGLNMAAPSARRALATAPSEVLAAPGLLLWRGFVNDPDNFFDRAWSLADQASSHAAASPERRVSPDHNLPNQKEEYISLELPDEDDPTRVLKCEHFASYGDGHELTYFRGTRNLPSPVLPLVEKLEALPAVHNEVLTGRERLGRRMDAKLEWRLTLNRYVAQDLSQARPGFPWHRDIEANGASTMILGLGSSGRLQFAEDSSAGDLRVTRNLDGLRYDAEYEPSVDLQLESGDLLVLTGKSRWEMIHRVVGEGVGGARASLVFGCW